MHEFKGLSDVRKNLHMFLRSIFPVGLDSDIYGDIYGDKGH